MPTRNAEHWLTQDDSGPALTNVQDHPSANGAAEIGTGETDVDADHDSSVILHYSDVAGDNFVVTAQLIFMPAGGPPHHRRWTAMPPAL